jgi:hypothetical protein
MLIIAGLTVENARGAAPFIMNGAQIIPPPNSTTINSKSDAMISQKMTLIA